MSASAKGTITITPEKGVHVVNLAGDTTMLKVCINGKEIGRILIRDSKLSVSGL